MISIECHTGLPFEYESYLIERYSSFTNTCHYIATYYPDFEVNYILVKNNEKLADIAKTETSASEQLEPSELQREQEEHKAEVMPPSESTKVLPKVGHNKHKTEKNVPATSIKEHLEPSELQRQQEEHNK